MAKTRLFTRDEVREKVAAATYFSFDRGIVALAEELEKNIPRHDNPLYKTIVQDMWKQLDLGED